MAEQRSNVVYGLRELVLGAPAIDDRAQLPLPIDLGPSQPATTDLRELLDVEVLHAVIDALPDAITLIHRDGRILLRNQAAFELLGPARSVDWHETAIEQNPRHPDGRPYVLEELPVRRTLIEGLALPAEPMVLQNVTTGADAAVLASSIPLRDPAGSVLGAAVVFRDLGALLERDRERDAFVRLVGHEVQVPLTAIRGYLQQAMRQLERDDAVMARRSLDRADANVGRLVTLLRDVLDTSRQQLVNPTPERVELGAFLADVHARFDPSLQARTVLNTPEFVHVRADRRLVETIVVNLVDNARKYTQGLIELSVVTRDEMGVVRVRDDGPGIPDDERDVIFEPFRRGSNASSLEGSGLGLYVCRQLAERHGGGLELEPSTQGAVFALSIPLA
jgi:signal transduction histidine kinase